MRIPIRVRPGAARTRVGGAYGSGDAPLALVVAVAERAVDGRATEASLRALAQALDVPRRDLTLVSGATARTKVVDVQGDEGALASRLADLLGS